MTRRKPKGGELIPKVRTVYRRLRGDYEALCDGLVDLGIEPDDIPAVVRLFEWDEYGVPGSKEEVCKRAMAKLTPDEITALGLGVKGSK